MTDHKQDELRIIFLEIESALEMLIDFWLQRCWDKDHGGFLTNFDANGKHSGTPEKYLNTQARMIWWYSAIYRAFPDKNIYLDYARRGAEWLIHHFWDELNGGWCWKVKRDGSRLDNGKVVYGQSFAIYALAEYYLASGDSSALEHASKTFDLLQIYCADTRFGGYYENLEPDWKVSAGGPYAGDRKGLDTHMHLLESFTVLADASRLDIHRKKLAEVVNLIVDHMIDLDRGCGLNQFTLDFTPIPAIAIHRTWNAEREGESPAIPTNTTSYGHNVELVWLMNRALEVAALAPGPYRQIMQAILKHAEEKGIDREFGGIFRDGTSDGGPLILEKEFWQHAEALVGFLDGYQVFQEQKYLDAFQLVWTFIKDHMVNKDLGEWKTLLDREGAPIDPNLGNPWKVAYHSGRALLECKSRLETLIQE